MPSCIPAQDGPATSHSTTLQVDQAGASDSGSKNNDMEHVHRRGPALDLRQGRLAAALRAVGRSTFASVGCAYRGPLAVTALALNKLGMYKYVPDSK